MRHLLVHRLRIFFFGMASRTFFALAMALPLAFAVDPTLVTLNIDTVRVQAFESDTTNYGEVKISRSTGLLTPQTINLVLSGSATLTNDYTLRINPADDGTKATLGTITVTSGDGTRIDPFIYNIPLTFLSRATDARIQVIAILDDAKEVPELGETVSISLPIIPPGTVVNGSRQRGTVTIVDAHVQLATYVDQSPAREIIPDDINGFIRDATGRMRLWFRNSSAFSETQPVTSYAPYVDRFIEATNAGSSATVASDFIATYRIGGKQRCVKPIGAVVEPTVTLLANAFRDVSEYGIRDYTSGGYFFGYSDGFSGQVIVPKVVAGVPEELRSITVESASQPSGAVINSIRIGGTVIAIPGATSNAISLNQIGSGSASGKTRIEFYNFTIPAPVGQGTEVDIKYTITPVGAGAVATPGDILTTVSMPILYPLGAHSLSVTSGSSPVLLSKGDVFVLDGGRYRVTGTKPTLGGGGSLGDYAIFFTPGLRQDLLRTSPLTITTHFEAKFDISGRETFFIPALPSTPYYGYPTGNADEDVTVDGNANDLPNGDWVDFLFSPTDDSIVEGHEDILLTLVTTTASNGYEVINPTVARIELGDNDVIVAAERTANAQIPTGDGSFTVELSQAFPTDLKVYFTVLQNTASGDAKFDEDYTIANTSIDSSGRVTGVALVPKGALSTVVTITPKATSKIDVNASRVIRVALDDSLDYALAGSESSSTNASVSTITITNTVTPPLITSGLIATAKVGTAFTYTTLTSGSAVSSFTATNLPPGLAIDASTGVISGIPTLANSYLVQLTATNDGGSDTKTLTITVNPTQPIINSPTTAIAIVNTSFTYVTTTDVPATSFSATNLPAGLSINTVSGIISGIPTAVGNSTVVISATNSGGTGTLSLALTVSSGLPSITSATTATATVGTTFTYSIVAPGATSFNATGLPSGLAIDTTTGVISGIPTVAGSSSITLTATNSAGSDTKTLALTVNRVSNSTTAGSSDASGGGMCGSGSGLALLLGSFSLLIVRLNSKRR